MSLTKKSLLDELVCTKPEKLPEKLFGKTLYVKPVSEFQRSRRLSSLYDKDGKVDRDALRKARIYTLVDHLCDEQGEPIFTDSDVKELLQLDALKLDVLIAAIEDWADNREGKLRGKSST